MRNRRIDMIADKRVEFIGNDNTVQTKLYLAVKPWCQFRDIFGHSNGEEVYPQLSQYWCQRLYSTPTAVPGNIVD